MQYKLAMDIFMFGTFGVSKIIQQMTYITLNFRIKTFTRTGH